MPSYFITAQIAENNKNAHCSPQSAKVLKFKGMSACFRVKYDERTDKIFGLRQKIHKNARSFTFPPCLPRIPAGAKGDA